MLTFRHSRLQLLIFYWEAENRKLISGLLRHLEAVLLGHIYRLQAWWKPHKTTMQTCKCSFLTPNTLVVVDQAPPTPCPYAHIWNIVVVQSLPRWEAVSLWSFSNMASNMEVFIDGQKCNFDAFLTSLITSTTLLLSVMSEDDCEPFHWLPLLSQLKIHWPGLGQWTIIRQVRLKTAGLLKQGTKFKWQSAYYEKLAKWNSLQIKVNARNSQNVLINGVFKTPVLKKLFSHARYIVNHQSLITIRLWHQHMAAPSRKCQ